MLQRCFGNRTYCERIDIDTRTISPGIARGWAFHTGVETIENFFKNVQPILIKYISFDVLYDAHHSRTRATPAQLYNVRSINSFTI